MASTERLPSGKWRPVAYDGRGKKITKLGTFPRKRDAADAAVEAESRARRKAQVATGTLTARTTWSQWWEYLDRRYPTSDSGRIEESAVRVHIKPQWGDVPLNDITHRRVQPWVDQLTTEKGLSPATVRRVFGIFKSSITKAVDAGVLDASPCATIKQPKLVDKAKPSLTPDQVDAAAKHLPEVWSDLLTVMIETGMRPGEVAGLHANWVDLDRGLITIADVYVRTGTIRSWPKNSKYRMVPITRVAADILRRRLDGREGPCGVPHVSGVCHSPLVFWDGKPCTPVRMNHYVRRSLRLAGVGYMSPYALRRGFANRMRRNGADVFLIKDLMGHASLDMTGGYVGISEQDRLDALVALERGTFSPSHGTQPPRQTPTNPYLADR